MARGRALAIVAALVLAAAGIRAHRIGAKPLRNDEICSVARADGVFAAMGNPEKGVIRKWPERLAQRGIGAVVGDDTEPWPPLYFLLLRAWKAWFGTGEAALRALSAIASIAAVAAGAALGWTLAGPRAACFAAALLAVAPLEVEYAQDARAYAFVSLAATVATLALVRLASDRPARRGLYWAIYAAAIAAGIAFHYAAAIVPAAHLAVWIVARQPRLERLPASLALAALLLAPLAPSAVAQLERGRGAIAWLDAPDVAAHGPIREAGSLAAKMVHGLYIYDRPIAGHAVAALLAVLVVALVAAALRRRDRRVALVAATAAAAPLVLVAFRLALGVHASWVPRYAITASTSIWVGAAVGLAGLRPGAAALALLLLLGGEADGLARTWRAPSKYGDVRACAAALAAAGCDSRDLAICASVLEARALYWYLPGDPAEVVADDSTDLSGIEAPRRNIFLVYVEDSSRRGERLHAQLAARFAERDAFAFDRARVFRFASADRDR